MKAPTPIDQALQRRSKRKVEEISQKAYDAFLSAYTDHGSTLSVEEMFAIGMNLLMSITVLPTEKLSNDPYLMRKQLIQAVSTHLSMMDVVGAEGNGHG